MSYELTDNVIVVEKKDIPTKWSKDFEEWAKKSDIPYLVPVIEKMLEKEN